MLCFSWELRKPPTLCLPYKCSNDSFRLVSTHLKPISSHYYYYCPFLSLGWSTSSGFVLLCRTCSGTHVRLLWLSCYDHMWKPLMRTKFVCNLICQVNQSRVLVVRLTLRSWRGLRTNLHFSRRSKTF